MTEAERNITVELISRYKQRLKEVWQKPNPYIKPLWEKSEIEQKVKELDKLK